MFNDYKCGGKACFLRNSWLKQLLELKHRNQISFSLDGDTPAINDRLRFRGSFKRVISCLECIRRFKAGKRTALVVSVGNTLSRYSYRRIGQFLHLMDRYYPDLVFFGQVFDIGNAKGKRLGIPASCEKAVKREIERLGKGRYYTVTTTVGPQRTGLKRCLCLNARTVFVDNEGNVLPCGKMLPGDSICSGSLGSLFPKGELVPANILKGGYEKPPQGPSSGSSLCSSKRRTREGGSSSAADVAAITPNVMSAPLSSMR